MATRSNGDGGAIPFAEIADLQSGVQHLERARAEERIENRGTFEGILDRLSELEKTVAGTNGALRAIAAIMTVMAGGVIALAIKLIAH